MQECFSLHYIHLTDLLVLTNFYLDFYKVTRSTVDRFQKLIKLIFKSKLSLTNFIWSRNCSITILDWSETRTGQTSFFFKSSNLISLFSIWSAQNSQEKTKELLIRKIAKLPFKRSPTFKKYFGGQFPAWVRVWMELFSRRR